MQENERYRELVARAVNFSEAWSQASDEKAEKLADAAERAIGLLDRALPESEAKGEAVDRLGSLVDRALKAGQLLEQEVAQARSKLDRQGEMVGKVLEISERAVKRRQPAAAKARAGSAG